MLHVNRIFAYFPRRPFVAFIALAYLWSWSWWSLVLVGVWIGALHWPGPEFRGVPYWMMGAALLGGWGPTLSGLVVTTSANGRKGVRDLLRRSLNWRLPARWYLAAWFLPPGMMGAALVIFYANQNAIGHFALWRWRTALLLLGINIFAGPLGEEIGWRGFLLPRMEPTFGSLKSGFLIGILWCFWHTPLFWAPMGTTVSGASVTIWAVAIYLVYVLGLSIIFTWIFDRSGQSVLPTIIMHLTVNADLITPFFPDLTAGNIRTIRELSIIPIWAVVLVLMACCRMDLASPSAIFHARANRSASGARLSDQ